MATVVMVDSRSPEAASTVPGVCVVPAAVAPVASSCLNHAPTDEPIACATPLDCTAASNVIVMTVLAEAAATPLHCSTNCPAVA